MQPTSAAIRNRIVTVDALRGFALLGIMLVHFLFWYTAGPLPEQAFSKYNDIGSTIVKFFNEIFLSGKFFAFFSFLFGLSFYLQTGEEKDGRSGVVGRFAWRITILLFIGLVHHAFWMGDILSIYAPLGFLLLLSRKLSNRWVLILGFLLVLNIPGKIPGLIALFNQPQGGPGGGPGDFMNFANEYDKLIKNSNLLQIFRYNLGHLNSKFDFQFGSGRIYVTMGFFLLGMFTGRQRWFEMGEDARPIWRKLCKRSSVAWGVCLAIGLALILANEIFKLHLEQSPRIGFFFSILIDVFSAALVVFYVSGLTLLMFRKSWQRFFYSLAPVGKMALTSYLTQTLFGLALFWGIGAGLYTKTSQGLNYLIAISFFVLQVQFSKRWLQSFYYGPVEWLWRSATLLKMQPLRRKAQQATRMETTIFTSTAESALLREKETV